MSDAADASAAGQGAGGPQEAGTPPPRGLDDFPTLQWHALDRREELARVVARRLHAALDDALTEREVASLVVSGGRTPAPVFEQLAGASLEWERIVVTLADERWVPDRDPDSNAALVRRHLLQDTAASARFVPLFGGEATPEEGEAGCERRLAPIPRPFDAVLLGMGADGHTASLFPGAASLEGALTVEGRACMAIRAPGAAQPRMTLTLSALLDARRIVLLITGEAKRRTLERALSGTDARRMPVRAVLRQERIPIEIHWAP